MVSSLLLLVTALTLAYVFSQIAKSIGLPRSVGQITAGLIIGIGFIKGILVTQEGLSIIEFLANLGVILLFYYVGLETNFKVFTKNIKRSVMISLFNTTIPLILGFIIMKFLFHFDTLVSLLIGICLSVSAQSVSIDILEELNMLKSKLGNIIVSSGAVDDTVELVLVSLILSVFHFAIEKITVEELLRNISIFILAILIIRVWVLPKVLRLFDKDNSSTTRLMGALIFVLLIVAISDTLTLGTFIGAIIAGVIVRQTIFKEKTIPFWEEHDITKSIHILAFGFLVPLFFVWIGLNTNIGYIFTNWHNLAFVLLLAALATIGTLGGTALAIMLNKGTLKEGLIVGWGLNSKGDIELVIATLALQAAIISQEIFTAIVLMSFTTTIISPIIFRRMVYKNRKAKLFS